jgi:hypothetical protein
MSLRTPTPRVLLPLVLLAAGSAGCRDGGAASPLEPPVVTARSSANSTLLHTGRYRETGRRNATGRAGAATLAARGVLWDDGIVRLLVTTGDPDHPDAAPGELAAVQLRVLSPAGDLLSTTSYRSPSGTGSHVFLIPGLVPGARVQAQANVRGMDRNRTGVVTVTETIGRPPVLSAQIQPVATAVVNVPAVIAAAVSETGGEAGVLTSCALLVEGSEVDRIERVWVDAGDAVSCAFSHAFTRPGTVEVAVEVEPVAAELGTAAPPRSTTHVLVVDTAAAASFSASVQDRSEEQEWAFRQSWWKPDGSHREYEHANLDGSRTQTASLTGTLSRAAVFPLRRVRLRLASTAAEWQSAEWSEFGDPVTGDDGRSCSNRLVPEHGGHFHLCTLAGTTWWGYTRFAGTVTYHSRGFWRAWDASTGIEHDSWSWNESSESHAGGGQLRPFGTAVSLLVEIDDGAGRLGASVTVPVTPFEDPGGGHDEACREETPYWLDGGVLTTCESRRRSVHGVRGSADG